MWRLNAFSICKIRIQGFGFRVAYCRAWGSKKKEKGWHVDQQRNVR